MTVHSVARGWIDDIWPGMIIVDGRNYDVSVAGINAALVDMGNAGGGTVMIPSNANITVTDTSVKIPNRVRLVGVGDHTTNPTFVASATSNLSAMIENTTQDGTQQFAYVEGIQVKGNRDAGATVSAGIKFKQVFLGSCIRDVLVWKCSGNNILIDGGNNQNQGGPIVLQNVVTTHGGSDNLLIQGECNQIRLTDVASENVDAGFAQIKITGSGNIVSSTGHVLRGIYFEGIPAADGLTLDQCSGVLVDGLTQNSATANNAVKITGSTAGNDGAFAAGGHVICNVKGNITTIIDDQVAGVTVGNAQGRFVRYYASPVSSATLDKSQVIGLQTARQGVNMAATGTMTISDGNYFVFSGNAQINNINTALRDAGRQIMATFSGTPIVATGGNLKLTTQFTADSTTRLLLESDGTNWWGGRLS